MLKHGFVNYEHSATAIWVLHFSFGKPCKVSFPSVEIRVCCFEGTLNRVISVISDSAQLRHARFCYGSIETCRKVSKSDVFVTFQCFRVVRGWRFGDTSPLFSGDIKHGFDTSDTKTPKTPK